MTSGPLKGNSLAEIGNVMGTVKYALQYSTEDAIQSEKLSASIHRSLNRKMIPYINALAVGNRSAFHHVYEWRKIGVTQSRLFDLSRGVAPRRGKTEIPLLLTFRPSTSLVPLTDAQTEPGGTGRTVTSRHRFHAKAYVMEYGIPVKIRPKRDGKLAFNPYGDDNEFLVFTRKTIKVNTPGGKMTKGAMRLATQEFFRGYGEQVTSGVVMKYIGNINKNVGAAIGKRGKVTVAVPNMNDARAEARAIVRRSEP